MNTLIPRSVDHGDFGDRDAASASPRPDRILGADHSADMEAIAAELTRLSEPGESAQGTRRSRSRPPLDGFDARGAVRDAVAEIARRQAALDGRGGPDGFALDGRGGPDGFALDGRGGPDGFALDGRGGSDEFAPGGRGGPGESALDGRGMLRRAFPDAPPRSEARGPAPTGRELSSEVSQTFARFSQDLHAAILATDARPDVAALGRQVKEIGKAVGTLPPADTVARLSEQTREMRDLLLASTRPAAVPAQDVRAGRPSEPAAAAVPPGFAETMADVRALLDGFKPGATLAAMESRLENLTDRLERGLDAQGPAGLIETLSQRVDEIHTSLRSRLDQTPFDAKPLEGLVRSVLDRLGQARAVSANVEQLEAAVRDVAARLDTGGNDPRGVQAIETQLARLSERLDRSEPSLKALDGVEHSLGELFSQFEVTRQVAIDAAETAARTAARDTLRAAMQNPGLAPRGADGPVLAEQVARGLDDLRAKQASAEERTQTTLADIRAMIERLALGLPVAGTGPRAADQPRRRRSEPGLTEAARPATDPADLLIEPGLGRDAPVQARRAEPRFAAEPELDERPASAQAGGAVPPAADGDGPASFIAAARRAAQAAQASAASAATLTGADRRQTPRASAARRRKDGAGGPAGAGVAAGVGTVARARSFLARQRRPILLGLAALVLLVGALEVVKLSVAPADAPRLGASDGAAPSRTRVAAGEAAPVSEPAMPARAAAAPAAVLPPAVAPSAPPLPTFVAGPARAAAPAEGIGEGLRSLADAGDPAAQYEVGLRYAEGRGLTRDPRQAVAWFEKAAARGSAPAQYRLGSAYEKGVGADRDPALAMSWYAKAADAGNIRAMHNLAVMSAEGAAGKPDYAKAALWFGKASAFGVRDSQFNLAILYARGLGVEQSFAQSYKWFAVAANGGDDDAGKKRDEVAAKLDPSALAAAKATVEAYHAAAAAPAANEVTPPPGGWDAALAPRPSGTASKVSQL